MPASERDGVDGEVLAAFDASLACLASLGAELEEVTLPASFEDLGLRVGEIIGVEGYHFVGDLIDDPSLPVDDDVRPRIQVGRELPARQYFRRRREQRMMKDAFDLALDGFDAVVTPTTGTAAPEVASIDQRGTAAGFTRPFNFIEWCALALPNGTTARGLPTSLQIACRGYQEVLALRIGAAYQGATDWHLRWPSPRAGVPPR
jgi:aspartyl-tRNA(Asn)/glutamyl-tRNA(Gln) amidotransferase subunit A